MSFLKSETAHFNWLDFDKNIADNSQESQGGRKFYVSAESFPLNMVAKNDEDI